MADADLISYLDRRFAELSQKVDEKVDGLREELRAEIQQARGMVEGIRSDVRLVAEAVIGQGEKLTMRQLETLQKIYEVMFLIGPLYKSLNGQVTVLQERAERETRDVLDVVRERYGKRA